MKRSLRDLNIWQVSVDLAADVLAVTPTFPSHTPQVLIDQMQRAAISVPSNIAEGKGRIYPRERRLYLSIARGSLYELVTQLEIATRAGFMARDRQVRMEENARKIGIGINAILRGVPSPTPKARR